MKQKTLRHFVCRHYFWSFSQKHSGTKTRVKFSTCQPDQKQLYTNKPRPDSDTMWPVVARATTEDGILQKVVKAINYSRRLEATYLQCQRVNSVGLLETRDFI